MMKLLIDCHVFDGKFQGTRTYLEGLYSNLTSHEDIEFYFAAQNITNLKRAFGEGANIHYIKLNSKNGISRLFIEIPKLIKNFGIDYAHFQYTSTWRKCCKEIITCHDLLFLDMSQYFPLSFRLNKGFFFKRSAKRADVMLTVSKYSKDELVRHYGIKPNDIYVTPNAVLPVSDNLPHPDIKAQFNVDKYILTVSRIEPRKNHLALVKAFNELRLSDKGYKLVMVGTYDFKYNEFSKYLNTLEQKTRDNIMFVQASFPELVELYRNASLFVFPSLGEGFGIPPLEALEYGCPLLCSNATAMAEFGLPQNIMFNPYDLDEMKLKMIHELNTPTDLREYRKVIASTFNWKKIADDFYQTVLRNL